MDKKKLTILKYAVIVLLTCAFLFVIYWTSTSETRHRNEEIEIHTRIIEDFQENHSYSLSFYIPDDLYHDPIYREFLNGKIQELFEQKDYRTLCALLKLLEEDLAHTSYFLPYITEFRENLTESFNAHPSIEDKLALIKAAERLEFCNANLKLTRDSLASYIDEHGENPIHTTPGMGGYYDGLEDEHTSEKHGIEGSALYDADDITYMGDFMKMYSHGVRLNSFYEETSYSSTVYLFKGQPIEFSPVELSCVYSGDYLFGFDEAGNLAGYENLTE